MTTHQPSAIGDGQKAVREYLAAMKAFRARRGLMLTAARGLLEARRRYPGNRDFGAADAAGRRADPDAAAGDGPDADQTDAKPGGQRGHEGASAAPDHAGTDTVADQGLG
jgi:hypothetical protein